MKKFSLVFSWVLSLGLLAGCNAPHTQPSMQKPVSAMPALPLDSDINIDNEFEINSVDSKRRINIAKLPIKF